MAHQEGHPLETYISESEREYWLRLRKDLGPEGILDQLVLFIVACNGCIRSAADVRSVDLADPAAILFRNMAGAWLSEEQVLEQALSRLHRVGVLEIRHGVYHVRNRVPEGE